MINKSSEVIRLEKRLNKTLVIFLSALICVLTLIFTILYPIYKEEHCMKILRQDNITGFGKQLECEEKTKIFILF